MLDADVDNLRTAHRWAVEYAHPLFPVVCGRVGEGLTVRGELQRALALAERVLAQIATPDDRRRLPVLEVVAAVALYEGRLNDGFGWAGGATATRAPQRRRLVRGGGTPFQGMARTCAGDSEGGLAIAAEQDVPLAPPATRRCSHGAEYSHAEALSHAAPDQAGEHYERAFVIAESVSSTFTAKHRPGRSGVAAGPL